VQAKLEETEMAAMKAGPKLAAKLETQLKAVESELENEQRRQADTSKNYAKADRRARELQFEVRERGNLNIFFNILNLFIFKNLNLF
jgi:hypothetical protein